MKYAGDWPGCSKNAVEGASKSRSAGNRMAASIWSLCPLESAAVSLPHHHPHQQIVVSSTTSDVCRILGERRRSVGEDATVCCNGSDVRPLLRDRKSTRLNSS